MDANGSDGGFDRSMFMIPSCEEGGPPPGFEFGPPPPGSYAKAEANIWKIVPPILISIGLFGNSLTIIVIMRHVRHISSTALFLLTLAISDSMILLTAPLRNWIIGRWEIDVRKLGEGGCKISIFLTYASIQFSSCILVCVTLERAISVIVPHRVRLGCTRRLSAIIIVTLLAIILTLNCHFFYGFGNSDLPIFFGFGYCEPLTIDYNNFHRDVWPWIDFAVVFAIPFAILVICNVIIIYKITTAHHLRRRMSKGQSAIKTTQDRDMKLVTMILILLNVVFFISLSPVSVYFIYFPYWSDEIEALRCTDPLKFVEQMELSRLVHAIVNCIGYLNATVNFFLYVISGSKFRNEVLSLLFCKRSADQDVFWSGSGSTKHRSSRATTQTGSLRSNSQGTEAEVNMFPDKDSVTNGKEYRKSEIEKRSDILQEKFENEGNVNYAFNTRL